jgi:hypothetical protein
MQAFLGNELANTLPRRYDSFGNQSVSTGLTHVSMEKWRPTQYRTLFHVNEDSTKVSIATNKHIIIKELLEVAITIRSFPKLWREDT